MKSPIILMGVAGSGKTTIGKALEKQLDRVFLDADDFHPEENKRKMAAGRPLNDNDRWPWLYELRRQIFQSPKVILACSALKNSYRKILDPKNECVWVHLHGSKEVILERMEAREGHYMKPEMLDSQFKDLEIPDDAIRVNIDQSLEEIIHSIISQLPSDQ